MATYPVTPTTATLDNVLSVAVPRDFRDSGWVQGTAIVKDASANSKVKQSVEIQRVVRHFNLKTGVYKNAALAAQTLATTDVLQVLPLDKGDIVTGGMLRVVTPASAGATNTITVQIGATAISSAISCLAAGSTAFATNLPLAITSADTVDFVLTGTTSPVFDAEVELTLFVVPASRA